MNICTLSKVHFIDWIHKATSIVNRKRGDRFGAGRILWINPSTLGIYLYQSSQLEILRHVARIGYTTVLISPRSRSVVRSKDSRVKLATVPLRLVPFLTSIMFSIVLLLLLPIWIVSLRPDFIIATQPEVSVLSLIPGLLVARVKKTKLVLDIRSTPVETSGFRGFQQKLWFGVSVLVAKKLFDGITFITPLMRTEVCARFRISTSRAGVWPSGVNVRLFDPENHAFEGKKLKSGLGLTRKFVVFYHGVFAATRGLTETIESMKILRSDYPDVAVFLLGTGPIVSELKRLVEKEGLQECVIIHDPVNYKEVPKFIETSDICIVPLPNHPYWRSQCPLKLLEYLAMEKVVIITDIPAHRSVIGDEKCGIYISSTTPAEIAESIVYAYNNKEKLAEWGKSGRTIINKKYAWRKVAEDLEDYLLSIEDRVG